MLFNRLTGRFLADESGQVAVITAVVALPLLLGVSIALDAHVTDRNRVKMQAALDNAAIAAISNQTISVDERNADAEGRFWANMEESENVKFSAASSENRIDVQGIMEVDTLFASLIGKDTIQFGAESAAEVVHGLSLIHI